MSSEYPNDLWAGKLPSGLPLTSFLLTQFDLEIRPLFPGQVLPSELYLHCVLLDGTNRNQLVQGLADVDDYDLRQ